MYRFFCGISFLTLVTGIAAAFAAGGFGWAAAARRRPDLPPWADPGASPLFHPELLTPEGNRQRRRALRCWAAALILGAVTGVLVARLAGPPESTACWVTSPTRVAR